MFRVKCVCLIISVVAQLHALPKSASRYFSPNLDGSKDSISIPLDIEDKALEKWKIYIYKKKGKDYRLIRLYESISAKEISKLTTKKFTKRIFEKKRSIEVPKKIIWDGYTKVPRNKKKKTFFDDNINETFTSDKVKDGEYYYRITAIDEAGNTSHSLRIPIWVDTVGPMFSLGYPETIFSPNRDGNKEKLLFRFNLIDFQMSSDSLSIRIVDEKENLVFEKIFNNLENKKDLIFNWNGEYKKEKIPTGHYTAVFITEDLAGNKKIYSPVLVELMRGIEKVSLTSTHGAFAPNNNGYFDLLTFNLSTSSDKDLEAWKLEIVQGEKLIYRFIGKRYLPEILIYEGQANGTTIIPDGDYQARLKLKYRSGNIPISPDLAFSIDTTPPKLSLFIENKDRVFLPKAKKNNKLIIRQSAAGHGDESYIGIISDINGDHVYYRDFKNILPKDMIWDGKNNQGHIATGRYRYTLFGQDSLGNKSELTSKSFEVIDELATVFLQANTSAFSPNGDGKKDEVKITVRMKKNHKSRVQKQKLQIYFKKKIIQEIDHSLLADGSPLSKLSAFKANYLWNGKDNSGKKLPDGEYEVKLKSQLTGGEVAESQFILIHIDTRPIEVDLRVETAIFSPNADGRKDTITIKQIKKPSALGDNQDQMTFLLKDDKGIVHRQQSWVGDLPQKIKWNGSDQTKSPVPEGIYTYVLKTVDHAENEKLFKTKPFKLVRKIESLLLTPSRNIFSHQFPKPIKMTAKFSSLEDFNRYFLVAMNDQGEKEIVAIKTNEKPIYFKGRNKAGNKLKDGRYRFYLQSFYSSGNHPVSSNAPFLIDSVGPRITINSRPKYFSPDGDGFNDILYLNIKTTDETGVDNSTVSIYRLREFDKKNKPFNQTLENYRQKEKPIKIWSLDRSTNHFLEWNGRNKKGNLAVESANDYQVFVAGTDLAGNKTIAQKSIAVDILVEKIGEGRYRVIINSINFKYDSDKMIGNYQKSLNRLAEILNKFKQYKFTITGHTDSHGGIQYNQTLSIKRAKAVYNYLIKRNIRANRMSIEGRGKSEPLISPEKTEDDERKNRRVEFYLIKEKSGN